MSLLTEQQRLQLLDNGSEQNRDTDHRPVVKLFLADAQATWLLTELDPDDPDIAFGLCDLGLGFPELGNVSITELASVKGQLGLPVERDQYFEAGYPISVYARAARLVGFITEEQRILSQAIEAPVILRARPRGLQP